MQHACFLQGRGPDEPVSQQQRVQSIVYGFHCLLLYGDVLFTLDGNSVDEQRSAAHYLQYELPDEVLICIFSYLFERDLCRVSQVCKRFQSIANDTELWYVSWLIVFPLFVGYFLFLIILKFCSQENAIPARF